MIDSKGRADALHMGRGQLEHVLRSARCVLFEWEPGTDALRLSANARDVLGYPAAVLPTSIALIEHVHEADVASVRASIVDNLKGLSTEISFRVRVPDGHWRTLLSRDVVSECSADGTVTCISGLFIDVTEQAQLEQRHALAVAGTHQGIWEWFPDDGNRFVADDSFVRLLGYPAGTHATVDDLVDDIVHPDDVDALAALIARLTDGLQDESELELRLRRADDRYGWFLSRSTIAERDLDGRPLRVIGSAIDIDDHRLEQERLATLMRTSRMCTVEWFPAQDRLVFDSSWTALSGYLPGEVASLSAVRERNLIHVVEADIAFGELDRLVRGEIDDVQFELRMRHNMGRFVWISLRGVVLERDEDGVASRCIGTLVDISDLKRTEQRLELAMQATPQGLWEFDLTTNTFSPDQGWRRLMGYENGVKFAMSSLIEGMVDIRDQAPLQAALDELIGGAREQYWAEYRALRPDGRRCWLLSHAMVAERDEAGRALRIYGSTMDITEIKQSEADSHAARDRHERAMASTTAGLWELDIPSGLLVVNERWASMLGYALRELRPVTLRWFLGRLDSAAALELDELVTQLQRGERTAIETVLSVRHKDGRERLVHFSGRGIRPEDGSALSKISGTSVDLSVVRDRF